MADEAKPSEGPSQIPSWVMLGFALGALLVWAIERPSRPTAAGPVRTQAPIAIAPPSAAPQPQAKQPPAETPFSTVENVFTLWSKYAVWDNDSTEIAIWDTRTRGYGDCFEVIRIQDQYYFRSIPQLTRPVLTHGGTPDECPVQFTETEEQREQWLRENDKAGAEEALRALGSSLGNKAAPPKP